MKAEVKRLLEISEYNYNKQSTQQKLFEQFIQPKEINRYSHRMSEMMAMDESETPLTEDGDYQTVVELINGDSFDVNNIGEFKTSLKSGDRGEFLTDYTEDEYGSMTTYKLKGYNIGFAIKSDGDIVSVHNNSGVKGIGSDLIKAAIRHGGTKLDHFDGFLTGLYSKNGFKVVSSDEWNDDFSPPDWSYTPIDPTNVSTSIYAKEINKYNDISQVPSWLKHKIEMYNAGKPDIVYREL